MSEFNISKIRKMDGALLLVFHELIECGNARQVAERLSLSQSAISHSLTRLRELFDDPLFIRKSHGLEPTRRSLALRDELRELLLHTEKLLDVDKTFVPGSTRRWFIVTAPEFFTSVIATSLVSRWQKIAPSISIEYRQLATGAAFDDIRKGTLDLAIGRIEQPIPSDLVQEVLYEDVYCIVARKRHPRIKGKITREQFEQESHVLASARSEVTRAESKIYPSMPSGVVVGNWMTAMSMVSESDCLATCHRKMAERFALPLGLQVIEPHFKPDILTVSVVRREKPDEGVEWLLRQIRDVVQQPDADN